MKIVECEEFEEEIIRLSFDKISQQFRIEDDNSSFELDVDTAKELADAIWRICDKHRLHVSKETKAKRASKKSADKEDV